MPPRAVDWKAVTARVRRTMMDREVTLQHLRTRRGVRPELVLQLARGDLDGRAVSMRDVLQLSVALQASIDWLLYGTQTPAPQGPAVVHVCRRGGAPCSECHSPHTKLCDFPLRGSRGGTCDRKLCDRCAVTVGPDKHYCGPHARLARKET